MPPGPQIAASEPRRPAKALKYRAFAEQKNIPARKPPSSPLFPSLSLSSSLFPSLPLSSPLFLSLPLSSPLFPSLSKYARNPPYVVTTAMYALTTHRTWFRQPLSHGGDPCESQGILANPANPYESKRIPANLHEPQRILANPSETCRIRGNSGESQGIHADLDTAHVKIHQNPCGS